MVENKQIMKPEWLKNIRCLAMDVDGVLTTGHIVLGDDQNWFRSFFIRDGMGIVQLHKAGFTTAFITSSQSPDIQRRAVDLKISYLFDGVSNKSDAFDQLLIKTGLQPEQVAFVGDDFIDIPVMKRCGLPIAVADAHNSVFEHVKYVTHARGGHGAIREICDYILKYSK